MPMIFHDNRKLPKLRAVIFKGIQPESDAVHLVLRSSRKEIDIRWLPCTVFIHQPIQQATLATLIVTDPATRQAVITSPDSSAMVEGAIERADNYALERIVELTVNHDGRIVGGSTSAARATTLFWVLTPAELLLDVALLKGGDPEALRAVSQILDAGLASDLVNLMDTMFHLTVQCPPSMLPGLLSIVRTVFVFER
jgi:hypothetical protein